MSQLPVKGQKQASTPQNKNLLPQKAPHLPVQQKVQNQVGFYSEQNNAVAARNVSQQTAVAEYKDLNDKKTGFAIHSLYALLVVLVGTAAYLYAMKVKPPKIEVVEKVVEKTVERVEYITPPPVETTNYSKIEIEVNVPRVEKKPEKNRFEQDFNRDEVRRKYDKVRSDLYKEQAAEEKAYLSNRNNSAMDWPYRQISHKYDDLKARIEEKENHEICSVTDSAYWCDLAEKFSTALKNKRSPAAETYPTYRNNYAPVDNGSSSPIYPTNPSSPANNGIDSVGKDVEEI